MGKGPITLKTTLYSLRHPFPKHWFTKWPCIKLGVLLAFLESLDKVFALIVSKLLTLEGFESFDFGGLCVTMKVMHASILI
jgi:hypothetical protein